MTERTAITKSELIEALAARQDHLAERDVELAVKDLLDRMTDTLAAHDRIEIRGFGSFTMRFRRPRVGRNPKTGEAVSLGERHVPHFKPGKELRERADAS